MIYPGEGMDDLITIVHQAGKIARLEAEIEQLRAENERLRAENERLKGNDR